MYCYIDLYEYYRRKHDLHSICIAPSAAITSTAVMTPTAATHRCYQQPVVEPPTFSTPSHTHHDGHKPMTWRTRVDRIQLEQPEHVFTGTVADTYFQKQIASGDILKDSSQTKNQSDVVASAILDWSVRKFLRNWGTCVCRVYLGVLNPTSILDVT